MDQCRPRLVLEDVVFARFGAEGLDGHVGDQAVLDAAGEAVVGGAAGLAGHDDRPDVEAVVEDKDGDDDDQQDGQAPVDGKGGDDGEGRADQVGNDADALPGQHLLYGAAVAHQAPDQLADAVLAEEPQRHFQEVLVEGAADVEDEALPQVGDAERLHVAEQGGEDRQRDHEEAQPEVQVGFPVREDAVDQGAGDQGRRHGQHRQQDRQPEKPVELQGVGLHEHQDFPDVPQALLVLVGRRHGLSRAVAGGYSKSRLNR